MGALMIMLLLVMIIFSCDQSSASLDIVLLAGQSNMAGRGGVSGQTWDGYVPPECSPSPRILRLSENLTCEEAHEPLHRDIDLNKTCGVGPGMAFANALLERDPLAGEILLVPCAAGGTNISQWQRGQPLYNRLVERANVALQDGSCFIRAMLWYQGESDSEDEASAGSYGARLSQFFSDIRLDLDSPLLPIVQVALASTAGTYVDTVRTAQFGIDLPNVVCIDAYGLEVKKYDQIHLSTPAQVQLGGMFADAVLFSDWTVALHD